MGLGCIVRLGMAIRGGGSRHVAFTAGGGRQVARTGAGWPSMRETGEEIKNYYTA